MRPSKIFSTAGRAGDERDLQRGRQHVEDHGGQDEVDAARAAVDHAVQRAGLALQVEAQVQRVQVREHAVCHVPDCALGYLSAQRRVGEGPGPTRRMPRIRRVWIEGRLFTAMLEAFCPEKSAELHQKCVRARTAPHHGSGNVRGAGDVSELAAGALSLLAPGRATDGRGKSRLSMSASSQGQGDTTTPAGAPTCSYFAKHALDGLCAAGVVQQVSRLSAESPQSPPKSTGLAVKEDLAFQPAPTFTRSPRPPG